MLAPYGWREPRSERVVRSAEHGTAAGVNWIGSRFRRRGTTGGGARQLPESESSQVPRTGAQWMVASAAAACIALAGCGGSARDDAAASDSALERDLTLASAVAAATPELRDTPDTNRRPRAAERDDRPPPVPRRVPAPEREPVQASPAAAPAPAPIVEAPPPTPEPATPPEPAPAAASSSAIAPGTNVRLTLGERACSDVNRPGDKMVAQTAHPVTAANGVVFPAGSTVVLEIASVVRSANSDSATLTFRVRSITVDGTTYPVAGEVVPTGGLETQRSGAAGTDRKKVIAGAILGAVIGRVAGGDARGAVVGAAAGAAVGAAASRVTTRHETCVPAGAELRLTVRETDGTPY